MPINTPKALDYLAVVVCGGAPYSYTSNTAYASMSKAWVDWYDQITWTDLRDKPSAGELADWENTYNYEWEVSTETKLENLTSTINAKGVDFYFGNTKVTNPKVLSQMATTSSDGNAKFFLTTDGTSVGDAIFTSVFDPATRLEVNDATNVYRWGWSLSGDKKVLTATISRTIQVSLLGINLLGIPTAAASVNVNLIVAGN